MWLSNVKQMHAILFAIVYAQRCHEFENQGFEYASLKAAADEEQTADEILLHDAQLERVRLKALLER